MPFVIWGSTQVRTAHPRENHNYIISEKGRCRQQPFPVSFKSSLRSCMVKMVSTLAPFQELDKVNVENYTY